MTKSTTFATITPDYQRLSLPSADGLNMPHEVKLIIFGLPKDFLFGDQVENLHKNKRLRLQSLRVVQGRIENRNEV